MTQDQKQQIIQSYLKRKFIVTVIGIIFNLLAAFKIEGDFKAKVVFIVIAAIIGMVFVITEGYVDAKAAAQIVYIVESIGDALGVEVDEDKTIIELLNSDSEKPDEEGE